MVWDYIVFAIFIIVSTIYPIWGDMRAKKGNQTKANYAFATGKVSMFAMMLSIARGTLGVRAFIGTPNIKHYFIFKKKKGKEFSFHNIMFCMSR